MALVGASSLKGKEIKAVLEEQDFPVRRLALLDAAEASGQLTEFEEEPAIIQPVGRDNFENMAVAFFACSAASAEQHWQMAEECGCEIVDLSYFLENHPRARVRAPMLGKLQESPGQPIEEESPRSLLSVSAHPAAIAIAGIVRRLSRRYSIVRTAVTIYEPVSERGQAGVDELHRQTRSLFSFQELPRSVFDAQVAFNLLPGYGEHGRPTLRQAQERIRDHVRRLLGERALQPALRLLQVPVFYGHAFCCFIELKEAIPAKEIEDALDQPPFTVYRDPATMPTVVAVAGSNKIVLGPAESDPSSESGYWVWGAMDNLRFTALNAVEIAEELLATHQSQITRP